MSIDMLPWFLCLLAAGLACVVGAVLSTARHPGPIFGKYQQPGAWFWVKYACMRAMLWLNKVTFPEENVFVLH